MRRASLPLTCVLLLQILSLSLNKSIDEITSSTPKLAKDSIYGSSLVSSGSQDEDIQITHEFPFTDKRMKNDQFKYERAIAELITNDLDNSTSVTNASKKYPQDSPAYLTIEGKFAYHLYIDDVGISLYTYSYNLILNSCGVNVEELRSVHLVQKKGDIFSQNIASVTRREILAGLLKESSTYTKTKQEQEIPLFITVHPTITFLPAAIIEDTLEDLRLDFPNFAVRYCKDCPNILTYDEYAYLTWLTISNAGATEDDNFFKAKDDYIINIGIQPKALFTAYPYNIAGQKTDGDKLVSHTYCLYKERHTNVFVQNVYYERSLDKFTSDFVSRTVATAADKHDSSTDVTVKFNCYPKHYKEKIDTFSMVGTGDLKGCRTDIVALMNQNYFSPLNNNFNQPAHDFPWPLENLAETETIKDAKIFIESDTLEDFYQATAIDQFKVFKIEDLSLKIDEYCNEFLNEEVASIKRHENQKGFLNTCIHLIYINSMLTRIKIPRSKELSLKVKNNRVETWLMGITIRNIESFHTLEKEWFYAVQDRTLETYLFKVREGQEAERERAVNLTFALVAALALTFWIGFIVRFSIKEPVQEGDKNKYK